MCKHLNIISVLCVFLLGSLFPSPASATFYACQSSEQDLWSVKEYVASSRSIIVGKVVGYEPFTGDIGETYGLEGSNESLEKYRTFVVFEIEILEVLKGEGADQIYVNGYLGDSTQIKAILYSAKDWHNSWFDLNLFSDQGSMPWFGVEGEDFTCFYLPLLIPGQTYVFSLDEPYHQKSFEPVIGDDDPFLKKVRRLAKEEAGE